MEARRWHMALARVMGKLARMARLPEIVGLAMPDSALFQCGGQQHTGQQPCRRAYPHLGAHCGRHGEQLSGLRLALHPGHVSGCSEPSGFRGRSTSRRSSRAGSWSSSASCSGNRWYVSGHGDTPVSGIPPVDEAPLGWPSAVGKAAVRSLTLLFRMVCITVPLMLCIEWLLKNGAFNFWEQYVPDQVNRFFPAELVSVVAAQMGGLVQSSAVAANLRAEGLIDNAQILLAMLVGSAVGNPFRTLRRNLPSALGIFPVPVAFAIVIGMQLSRFVVTLVAIAGVIAFMHYVLY